MVSTSGTVGATTIQVVDILEDAMRACGLSTGEMTPDNWVTARLNLYLYLSALANDGIQLWTIQKYIIGLIPNQQTYSLDLGAVDVLNAVYRSVTTPSNGTPYSSAGGTASSAFDGDIATACTQTSPDGYIEYQFSQAFSPVMVGILPNGNATYNLVYEYSNDGITYTTVYAPGSLSYTDLVWDLHDIDPVISALYWRVRETGGATLNLTEVMFGASPYEINIARLSNDVWANQTSKWQPGLQPLQFWVDRQVTYINLKIWPIPTSCLNQIVTYRRRQIQDVGTLTNKLEIPQRWQSAINAGLADRLVMRLDYPMEKRQEAFLRKPILQQAALEEYTRASMEERDSTPINILSYLRGYTGYGGSY